MTKPSCEDTYLTKRLDLNNDYYSFKFAPYSRAQDCHPGQFIHLLLPSTNIPFRRAFSVASADPDKNEVEIIFKVFGRGTRLMGNFREGDMVNFLGPLGVPFALPSKEERVIIIAGGVGFPPLMFLAQRMIENGHQPGKIEFFYGGKGTEDILEVKKIRELGVNFRPVTEDGTCGQQGLVTEPLERFLVENRGADMRVYSCGPEPMLRAVDKIAQRFEIPGQVSVEAPMPCGIGICLGCVIPRTEGGHSRVCCDGPVFEIGEVVI